MAVTLALAPLTVDQNQPRRVSGLLASKKVTDISLAAIGDPSGDRAHTCAVADGRAYCWGWNTSGALGDNSTTSSTIPVTVNRGTLSSLGTTTVKQIAVGRYHSCALTDQALPTVYCWGGRTGTNWGLLGNNSDTITISLIPTAVYTGTEDGYGLGSKTITNIVARGNRTCVIANGSNFCWGFNSEYQIGDGTTITRTRPTIATYLDQQQKNHFLLT